MRVVRAQHRTILFVLTTQLFHRHLFALSLLRPYRISVFFRGRFATCDPNVSGLSCLRNQRTVEIVLVLCIYKSNSSLSGSLITAFIIPSLSKHLVSQSMILHQDPPKKVEYEVSAPDCFLIFWNLGLRYRPLGENTVQLLVPPVCLGEPLFTRRTPTIRCSFFFQVVRPSAL